jgi:hypothetical protein
MNFSHRFFLYGPFAMLVALAAGVMIYWWIAATALSAKLDALNGHEIAPGIRMSFASKRIAGFPFRLDAIFDGFTVQFPGAHGPVVWRADKFATHNLTYATDVTVMEAAGPQEISWTSQSGAAKKFAFTPGALRASTVVDAGQLQRFDLDAISVGGSRLAAGRAQFHFRRDPTVDALDLVVDLQALRMAGDAANGFPEGLSHVHVQGELAPAGSFLPLLAGQRDWRAAMNQWRAGNGFFKVDQAAAYWGKCEATSSGNLQLDDAHRFAGALAFSIGSCGSLAKQAEGVTATSRAHRAILIVLAALAAVEPPDQSGALPAALVFRDGVIFVAAGKPTAANSFFEPVGLLHAVY